MTLTDLLYMAQMDVKSISRTPIVLHPIVYVI